MVAIALKSTSRMLRFLLKLGESARCAPTRVWGKVILVLNALITLGQNNISIGSTYMLGDKQTNQKIY
jgi:hypothetical protein